METYRLRTSDIEAVQIDAQWQLFLEKEHGISANLDDYCYMDVSGNFRVMEKVKFERLFQVVSTATN